jgi:hypothetical protein
MCEDNMLSQFPSINEREFDEKCDDGEDEEPDRGPDQGNDSCGVDDDDVDRLERGYLGLPILYNMVHVLQERFPLVAQREQNNV